MVAVVVAGGLPIETQRVLDAGFAWWHSKLIGMATAFVEFFAGYHLLRQVILAAGLGHLARGWALLLGGWGLFFLLEGLLRLGITPCLDGVAAPSLVVLVPHRLMKGFLARRSTG